MIIDCPVCAGSGKIERPEQEANDWAERLMDILTDTAAIYAIRLSDMVGPSRKPLLVEARSHAMARMRSELGLGLKTIGFYLGGRHHSTVLHGLRRARA